MPGIDYRQLRAAIAMTEVLQLIGFVPAQRRGHQLRGPCPVHGSTRRTSRTLSINLRTNTYRCFKCGSAGNQLDLYAAVTRMNLFEAAIDLCRRLNRPPPWIHRW
jgi:DNA primase